MAGVKISTLPVVLASQLTDFGPFVQNGVTSRETLGQIITLFNQNAQLNSVNQVTGLPAFLNSFLPLTGGTLSGPLVLAGNPVIPNQAANKAYVDLAAGGFTVILATQAATTVNLNATQAGAGVGATLTNAGTQVAFVVDGYTASVNDRILVKNQTLTQHNGVYVVTNIGSGSTNWVLTRATDYDTAAQIKPGTLIAVNNGTVNGTTSWLETATVVTVDTDPILFSQFTFAPAAFFQIANNLSEGNPATMRTNLGLGTASIQNVAFFLQSANNLSDVASVPGALVNLGLGVPTGTGNVVLQTSPTLITPTLGAATASSLVFAPSTGGIIGTISADNAGSGKVGEFISASVASGSAVAFTSNVVRNITSIGLTAGDWDVWGNITFNSDVGFGLMNAWCSITGATQPDTSLISSIQTGNSRESIASITTPMLRVNVTVNTTVFLSGLAVWSTGSVHTGCGTIYARRVR